MRRKPRQSSWSKTKDKTILFVAEYDLEIISSWDYGIFVPRKLILQTRMRSHPVGLDGWLLVWPFVYFHSSCVRTAKALARLRGCAGSPSPSPFAYAVSTKVSWAGSNTNIIVLIRLHGPGFYWHFSARQHLSTYRTFETPTLCLKSFVSLAQGLSKWTITENREHK